MIGNVLRGIDDLDEVLGVKTAVRWAVWFGWPAFWLLAKVRVAFSEVASAGGGLVDVSLSGASSSMSLPAPWEVVTGVLTVGARVLLG